MEMFPWGLFAVLVGTFLPLSVLVRSSAQFIHDAGLGLTHTLNLYRAIKISLVIPFLAIIGPTGFFLMFGSGDADQAVRVVNFLGTARGFVTTTSLLIGVLLIDVFRPRLTDQLTRVPISTLRRTRLQFRNDTAVLAVCLGAAVLASVFVH